MVMSYTPFRRLYDGETMADHPRPHYWFNVIPPRSFYCATEWEKFYDPQVQPMGVAKLCVLDDQAQREMRYERKTHFRELRRTWAMRFVFGSLLLVSLVVLAALVSNALVVYTT